MFRSDNLIGFSKVVMDEKNRIVVPSFTGASSGDELLLYGDDGYLSIYEKQYLLNCFSNFCDMKSDLKLGFFDNKKCLDDIFFNVLGSVTVDMQKRICLPQYIIDYYLFKQGNNNQNGSNHIIVKGAWNHINLYSDSIKSRKLVK